MNNNSIAKLYWTDKVGLFNLKVAQFNSIKKTLLVLIIIFAILLYITLKVCYQTIHFILETMQATINEGLVKPNAPGAYFQMRGQNLYNQTPVSRY